MEEYYGVHMKMQPPPCITLDMCKDVDMLYVLSATKGQNGIHSYSNEQLPYPAEQFVVI